MIDQFLGIDQFPQILVSFTSFDVEPERSIVLWKGEGCVVIRDYRSSSLLHRKRTKIQNIVVGHVWNDAVMEQSRLLLTLHRPDLPLHVALRRVHVQGYFQWGVNMEVRVDAGDEVSMLERCDETYSPLEFLRKDQANVRIRDESEVGIDLTLDSSACLRQL